MISCILNKQRKKLAMVITLSTTFVVLWTELQRAQLEEISRAEGILQPLHTVFV